MGAGRSLWVLPSCANIKLGGPAQFGGGKGCAKERAPSVTWSRRARRRNPSPQGGSDAGAERERTIPVAEPRRRSAAG